MGSAPRPKSRAVHHRWSFFFIDSSDRTRNFLALPDALPPPPFQSLLVIRAPGEPPPLGKEGDWRRRRRQTRSGRRAGHELTPITVAPPNNADAAVAHAIDDLCIDPFLQCQMWRCVVEGLDD